MTQTYCEVERLTIRYVQYCLTKIERQLQKSRNKPSAIARLREYFINGVYIAELDIYHSQLIILFAKGVRENKPLIQVLEEMERFRQDLAESLHFILPVERSRCIYDSRIFVKSDCEKLRSIIQYFGQRLLLAYLFRISQGGEGSKTNGVETAQADFSFANHTGGGFLMN